MIRKSFFPITLLLLGGLFWISPTAKEVVAGIAILLFGMIMLEEGFNTFVEGPLQIWLRKITDKLYKSMGLGFVVTGLLQSSSLISVVTISFLSAGLIDLKAGIGIIFGSNIGTTATAWLVAVFGLKVNVSAMALPVIAFGVLFFFQKNKIRKSLGSVLAGLGFFFLGIHYMKLGFDGYQESINLAEYAMPGFLGLVVFTCIGVVITLLLQSSSASMALILTALAAGQISYTNSLALAVGANIGTTITAVLGSLSANQAGKRLAGAHMIFNMVTGLIALIFISQLGQFVEYISSSTGVLPDNYTLKLSIFHSVFNVLGVLIMVPFINPLVKFLNRVFVDEEKEKERIEYPVFLTDNALAYPQTAYRALLDESKRLFEEGAFEIISHALSIHRADILSEERLKEVIRKSNKELVVDIDELYYSKVKIIYAKIIEYATLAQGKFSLSAESMDAFTRIKLANRKIVEAIKELRGLNKNVIKYMNSENRYIQKEYNQLRQKVSVVLREIYLIQIKDNPEEHLKKLGRLREKAVRKDVLLDGTLDTLIREQKISSEMAASLANDSDNVARITQRLIEIAELLYVGLDTFAILTKEEKQQVESGLE